VKATKRGAKVQKLQVKEMGGKKRKREWRKKMWLVGNHFLTTLSSREVVEENCSLQTASAVGTSTEMTSSEMSLHYIVISGHISIAGQLFDKLTAFVLHQHRTTSIGHSHSPS
jgi:hypothetical protein